MGYPGKNHKSYQTPKRPFEKTRIETETRLVMNMGCATSAKSEKRTRENTERSTDLSPSCQAISTDLLRQRNRTDPSHAATGCWVGGRYQDAALKVQTQPSMAPVSFTERTGPFLKQARSSPMDTAIAAGVTIPRLLIWERRMRITYYGNHRFK
jgi:hypothetical protein